MMVELIRTYGAMQGCTAGNACITMWASLSVPASWQQFTRENLERARQKREFSMKLRSELEALLKASATDIWNQFNCVTNAFNARVQQTKDAISKLQCHLQKVLAWNFIVIIIVCSFVRSSFAGRGPAYSGPQHRDLYICPMRQPRERRGIGRCVRCRPMCALCKVEEGTVGVSSLSSISKRAFSRRGLLSG